MRTLMLVALLGLSAAAVADPPVPQGTKDFIKLQGMTMGPTIEARSSHLVVHGFSQKGAEDLVAALDAATADLAVYERGLYKAACDRKDELLHNNEKLAEAFEQIDAATGEAEAKLVASLADKLTGDDKTYYADHLASHPDAEFSDSHGIDKIREGKGNNKVMVDTLCFYSQPHQVGVIPETTIDLTEKGSSK
ncbi:MAG TPA: hypothetical protein VEZ88_13445 [Steroidobacteraceae bacterium]|nr:hypothetical protein [Steroidobacteraceae bacterium]